MADRVNELRGYIESWLTQFEQLDGEFENFLQMAKRIQHAPANIPKKPGLDIYGGHIPLTEVGGDHLIYLDFKERYNLDMIEEQAKESCNQGLCEKIRETRHRAGILLADAAGHQATDAFLAAQLHQAFMMGVLYELPIHGEITLRLFEELHNRFWSSSFVDKFITLIYSEINENGVFRFISAGHPKPLWYSSEKDKFIDIGQIESTQPIGFARSRYNLFTDVKSQADYVDPSHVNERRMACGDILILYTDGLMDHENNGERYFPSHLEQAVRGVKEKKAEQMWTSVREDLFEFNKHPTDDISYVFIKKE
jgi:serine phosphatase RsbU (regulator of sigma subunit)